MNEKWIIEGQNALIIHMRMLELKMQKPNLELIIETCGLLETSWFRYARQYQITNIDHDYGWPTKKDG